MLRSRWSRIASVAALCGGFAAVGAGIAIADENQQPTTTPAIATFTANLVKTNVTTCQGTDGTYHQDQSSFTGTSSGNDPRLTGNITVESRSLINVSPASAAGPGGYGTSKGTIVLRDPTTGQVKSEADFVAVNTYNGVLHGFEIARLKGTDTVPAATLYANFSAAFNSPGTSFTGTLGDDGGSALPPPHQPAVIQSGACSSSGGDEN